MQHWILQQFQSSISKASSPSQLTAFLCQAGRKQALLNHPEVNEGHRHPVTQWLIAASAGKQVGIIHDACAAMYLKRNLCSRTAQPHQLTPTREGKGEALPQETHTCHPAAATPTKLLQKETGENLYATGGNCAIMCFLPSARIIPSLPIQIFPNHEKRHSRALKLPSKSSDRKQNKTKQTHLGFFWIDS